jgi:hypothetical protein
MFLRATTSLTKWQAQDSIYDDSNSDDEQGEGDISSPHVLRQGSVVKAWDELYGSDLHSSEHLLFWSRNVTIDLATLHPSQAQIFKLWQIYLENVDPLLKVTHTPTLQPRIIDAASDLTSINPTLEALMFSIYCMAIFSLNQEDCRAMFGTLTPREDIIRRYQLGAKEALLRCGFLKSGDRDCLTALHLYLVSSYCYLELSTNISRSRSNPILIRDHYPQCWVPQYALLNAWALIQSLPMPDNLLLRRSCVDGYGGH